MLISNVTDLIKYFILGLVQGLAEPLPISSSAHVIIFSKVLSLNITSTFNLWVNIGSFFALLLFFHRFLWQLISGFFLYLFKKDKTHQTDFFYCLFIIVALLPAALIGFIFEERLSTLQTLLIIALGEIITGIVLILVSSLAKTDSTKEIDFKTSLGVGFFQIFALLPGISRSGITTSYALHKKISLPKALRFSFILYLPISLASTFLGLIKTDFTTINIGAYLSALGASFIATTIMIQLFFKFITKERLKYFGFYCLIIGIIILFFFRSY